MPFCSFNHKSYGAEGSLFLYLVKSVGVHLNVLPFHSQFFINGSDNHNEDTRAFSLSITELQLNAKKASYLARGQRRRGIITASGSMAMEFHGSVLSSSYYIIVLSNFNDHAMNS